MLDGENVQICKKTYDKIHKISYRKRSESNYQVACAAGREILHAEIVDKKIQSSFVTKISDWISNISVLSTGLVVVVTSHNIAALLSTTDQKAIIKDKLRCDENSTLYCSCIYGNEWENIYFFGGTALGELVVWTKASGIIYRQFLHNGVIFSIDFNGSFLVTKI